MTMTNAHPPIRSIAIIGSGISGLVAAHLLHDKYDIKIFEANNYIGGHTNTVSIKAGAETQTKQAINYNIDTGFIVFNHKTYPNFIKLLAKLGVEKQESNMSFSISHPDNPFLEYSGENLLSVFAQKRNFLRPKFYYLLFEINKFNRLAKKIVQNNLVDILTMTLIDFIEHYKFSDYFQRFYFYPLASAIWSTPTELVQQMPVKFIFDFYFNHGLLSITNQPQWYVIKNGSNSYVKQIIKPFKQHILLNTAVKSVQRDQGSVQIKTENESFQFDAVVFACHSDQALALLEQPTSAEQDILSQLPYVKNSAILHTDTSSLPKHKAAWASWNYVYINNHKNNTSQTSLTYYMNKLQSIPTQYGDFCVSINHPNIHPNKILASYEYAHPLYNINSVKAKRRHHEINNQNRSFYVGAYWGNGFHEDGVVSSIKALAPLGVSL